MKLDRVSRRASCLAAATGLSWVLACNDLTEPLPQIAGAHAYVASSPAAPALNRQGLITITDSDRRTARFDGTFTYTTTNGQTLNGKLTGAFITPDSIWFRFLNERFEYHEASYIRGLGRGEIFLQGFTYQRTGVSFSLQGRSLF